MSYFVERKPEKSIKHFRFGQSKSPVKELKKPQFHLKMYLKSLAISLKMSSKRNEILNVIYSDLRSFSRFRFFLKTFSEKLQGFLNTFLASKPQIL
jgi:hypothetical protein